MHYCSVAIYYFSLFIGSLKFVTRLQDGCLEVYGEAEDFYQGEAILCRLHVL